MRRLAVWWRLSAAALCLLAYGQSADTMGLITAEVGEGPNPWTSLQPRNEAGCFQFAVVSDNTGGARKGVFGDAVGKLNLLQPEFVVSVGDLIEGYTEDRDLIEKQWDEFEGYVKQLRMPFFYVPGNHDITNAVMAEIWRERFGRSYYHFRYQDVLFLCLNSEDPPPSNMSDEQVDYVARALYDNRDVYWTLVFLHKPLWTHEQETGWEKVEALLQGREYTVFAGHLHRYEKQIRHNRRYLILATTGGSSPLRGPAFGEFDHLVWVTMTEEGPVVANLMLDGIWDDAVRTRESGKLVSNLLAAGSITVRPLRLDDPAADRARAELRINNDADLPMMARISLVGVKSMLPAPAVFERAVSAKTLLHHEASLFRQPGLPLEQIQPLEVRWTLRHEPTGLPAIERAGVARLIIDATYPCEPLRDTVAVDGLLDEWPALAFICETPAQILGDAASWAGRDDCSFRFDAAHDKEMLYIAGRVYDERVIAAQDVLPWQQDGFEVRLDARSPDRRTDHDGTGEFIDFLLVAASPSLGETPAEVYERGRLPAGTQVASAHCDGGYAFEIAIPVSYLNQAQGSSWRDYRLNIAVNDLDDANGGPVAQLWWRPDWRTPETFAHSGTFVRDGGKKERQQGKQRR